MTLLSSPLLISSSLSRRHLMRATALLPGLALWSAARAQTAPKPDSTVDMAKALEPGPLPELSIGDPAGVPVIEYGSATCPHCAHFDRDIWPEFKKSYVDTGKVRFIFREYSRNNLDVGAFMLARCVGDDKAFATIELLFASQDSWAFGGNPLDGLIAALRPTGMSHDKANACLKDQAKADAFAQIVKTADDKFKVSGTPTFIIDGKIYGGALSLDELNAILKPLVK
ncbi:DsbA family protein [Methylocapsa sp. S129]|uniref:DsbA family protein n=1 Tax=Methylocapsa sp. S129 TaxID=1641869 RepID=UPI00131A65E2|nr:DsbA family protein [Methylocapsa sp. S129]